jgi:transposase
MRWIWSVPRSRPDFSQAETGYDLTHFSIDWEAEQGMCPQGRISSSWTPVEDAGKSSISVKFSASAIGKSVPLGSSVREPVAARSPYTHGSRCRRCLQHASARRPPSGSDTYRHRAGIEGLHAQALRALGLRRSRYVGLCKTHLGHVAEAFAINVIQLMSWLRGEMPEQTRTSPFKRVMELAA